MKKVNIPIALPIILGIAIVVLSGVLIYNVYTPKEPAPVAPQVQTGNQNNQAINTDYVHQNLMSSKEAISASFMAQSASARGRYLDAAAKELDNISLLCSPKEQSLKQFAIATAGELSYFSKVLQNGANLSETDSANLQEIVKSLDAVAQTTGKAATESNGDYLRGEFPAATIANAKVTPIEKEKAQELAKSLVPDANLVDEQDGFYSFNTNEYILEVAKDGGVQYRRLGYGEGSGQVSRESLPTFITKAKEYLKEKGFGDMAVYRWNSGKGEIYLEFYPTLGHTVYLNSPFGVIMSIDSGEILGLKASTVVTIDTPDKPALKTKLEQAYKDNNYIIKIINEYGAPCYQVSYNLDGKEYLANWLMDSEQEIQISRIVNSNYGRDISPL